MQCGNKLFHVVEVLWESSGAAIGSEVRVVHSSVVGAFKQNVLDHLDWLTTRAADLFQCM